MTNKPTWEETTKYYEKKYRENSWEREIVDYFVSTKLAEQKQQLIEKIEAEMLGTVSIGMSYGDVKQGFDFAKEVVINLIKQD